MAQVQKRWGAFGVVVVCILISAVQPANAEVTTGRGSATNRAEACDLAKQDAISDVSINMNKTIVRKDPITGKRDYKTFSYEVVSVVCDDCSEEKFYGSSISKGWICTATAKYVKK